MLLCNFTHVQHILRMGIWDARVKMDQPEKTWVYTRGEVCLAWYFPRESSVSSSTTVCRGLLAEYIFVVTVFRLRGRVFLLFLRWLSMFYEGMFYEGLVLDRWQIYQMAVN